MHAHVCMYVQQVKERTSVRVSRLVIQREDEKDKDDDDDDGDDDDAIEKTAAGVCAYTHTYGRF